MKKKKKRGMTSKRKKRRERKERSDLSYRKLRLKKKRALEKDSAKISESAPTPK